MSFASIGIKTTIPATAPAATSGALTFFSIEDENWLQITGDASAGAGSLYVLRWNADLAEWRPYMEDKPIMVDSSALDGLFSAYYPFPKGEESFVLYDPAAAITATASASRTGSPLAPPAPVSSAASGVATEAKQDTGNASLASIDTKLTAPLSVTVTPGNTVNAANSSTTPLAGGATFTGTGTDILAYAGAEVTAYSNVAGTLYLEYSIDNTNWDVSLPYTLTAGVALHIPAGSDAQYFRVRYVNGGSAQAVFRLQTLLLGTIPTPHSVAISSVPLAGSSALLSQAEIIGLSSAGGGTYVPVKVAPSGAVQMEGEVTLSPNAPGLTVTMSSKSSSATSVTMLSANSARKGATFYNDDANPL